MRDQLGDLRTETGTPLGQVRYTIAEREDAGAERFEIRGHFIWDDSVNTLREHQCCRLLAQSGENLFIDITDVEGQGVWPHGDYRVAFYAIHPPIRATFGNRREHP